MLLRDPSSREERFEKMYRRLGDRNLVCVVCGEDDPRTIELHHPAGQAYSDEVVPICRNCHRKTTFEQEDHPTEIPGRTREEVAEIRRLLGWADIHRLQAEHFETQALKLFENCASSKGERNDT